MTYYLLKDKVNKGKVVRAKGKIWDLWENGEWVPTGILMDYFMYHNDLSNKSHDDYEEISEEEALSLIAS